MNPDTLCNLIAEFVTREWPDTEYSLDTKIDQVLDQLRSGQAKIVFDLVSKTCNIIHCR
ncbi:MAG: YheU family protein [Candidatus Cloacimonetes bacterium]|nr:YheU family protein [Candidatus Cloacimonadota bacterium]